MTTVTINSTPVDVEVIDDGIVVTLTLAASDLAITGQNYLSLTGQLLTANPIDLAANVTGNLPVANLNAGTNASSTSRWSGDGTWQANFASSIAIVAAGTSQTDATALTSTSAPIYFEVTTGSGGVKLPTANPARGPLILKNSLSAALNVYSSSGSQTINGIAATAAYVLPPGGVMTFISRNTTTWQTVPYFGGGDVSSQAGSAALAVNAGVFTTFKGDNTGATDTASAVQSLFASDGSYFFPTGSYLTGPMSVSNRKLIIEFGQGATLLGASGTDVMWEFTNCDVTLVNFNGDGQSMAQTCIWFNGGTVKYVNGSIKNMGMTGTMATDIVLGLRLTGCTSIRIDGASFSNMNAIGNGTFGDGIGAVRDIYLDGGCGFAYIAKYTGSGDGDAEELDLIQSQLGNIGGVIIAPCIRYNGNTRRCIKIQSGDWDIIAPNIGKSSSFVPVSGSTNVGLKNVNCVDYAAGTGNGSVTVHAGTVDASGFVIGVCDSGGGGIVRAIGTHIIGSTLTVNRNDPQTGSPVVNGDTIGFYAPPADQGSGMLGCVVQNFTNAFTLQGSRSFVDDTRFIDPVNTVGAIGSSTQKSGFNFHNNRVFTQTSGYLNQTRMIRVFNMLNGSYSNNRIIEDGNTTHATKFIEFTDANATGYCSLNTQACPVTPVTPVTVGSSAVVNFAPNALVGPTTGGTGVTSCALGDTIYGSAANVLATLPGNTTATKKFITQTGTGTNSAAPTWGQPAFSDLSGSLATTQLPALAGGDVTSSAGSAVLSIGNNVVTTAKINANAVTNAKMATSTANTIAGYDNSGNFSDVTIGSGLSLSAGVLASTGSGGGTPGGSSGQMQYNNAGAFGGFTMGGDATINTGTGALTVIKTNGVAFAPSATTDTTNASNITSGDLALANGGTGATTAANARSNLGVAIRSIPFFIGTPANQTVTLDISLPYACTINGINNIQTSSGTITATLQINGVNVTGLSSISVTSTPASPTASAANTASAGNSLTLILSAASSPFDLTGSIHITV